jgi:hypothetical protein
MAQATDQRTNTSKHKKTQKTKKNKITVGENHGNISSEEFLHLKFDSGFK